MQQPSFGSPEQPHTFYPGAPAMMPPPPPAPRKNKVPKIIWFFLAFMVCLFVLSITLNYYRNTQAKSEPLIVGNQMIWFDVKNQSKTSDAQTAAFFETQGLLKISYSCQRNSNYGLDVSFGIYQKEGTRKDKLIWYDEVVDCPETRSATVSVEAGEYLAAVLTYGNSQWSMKVWQEF